MAISAFPVRHQGILVYAARQVLGTITLRNGDLIAMERWTQAHLKHGIAKLPQGILEDPRRINLTWRWVRSINETVQRNTSIWLPAQRPSQCPTDKWQRTRQSTVGALSRPDSRPWAVIVAERAAMPP